MDSNHLLKTLFLSLLLVITFTLCLELYWRSKGYVTSFNEDKVLWSKNRRQVYMPMEEATVFIGGSRIKFDLDVPAWEKLTGEKAIQLALGGTPGRLTLRDLANDKNFKGKLIIDCAEPQFFYPLPDSVRRDRSAREALEYYHNETPAQFASANINFLLESQLALLEEGKLGLIALLNDIKIPNRPGVVVRRVPEKQFSSMTFNRQSYITSVFLTDTSIQRKQKDNWMWGIKLASPIKGDTLQALLQQTKAAIDKIKSRGGKVIFVRPPSDGPYREMENRLYSRQKYWDYLLTYTNCQGIHYADYPGTAKLICAEWSHLALPDAATYTTQLVKILQEEKGWTFPKKSDLTSDLR